MPKKKTEISKEEKEAWQKKAMLRNNPVIFKDDCFTKQEIERTRGKTKQS